MSMNPKSKKPNALAVQRAEDDLYYRRVLQELVEMGVDMGRSIQARAKAADPAAPGTPELTAVSRAAYERTMRSVRLTMALERRIAKESAPTGTGGVERAMGTAGRNHGNHADTVGKGSGDKFKVERRSWVWKRRTSAAMRARAAASSGGPALTLIQGGKSPVRPGP